MTWWRWNREAFLGGGELTVGPRTGDAQTIEAGLARSVVDERIVPALYELLEAGDERTLLNTSLIALGHTDAQEIDDLSPSPTTERLRTYLEHSSRWVSENATLALGLSANADSARVLARLVRGGKDARQILGGKHSTDRGRAFAAYSLAMVARRTENPDVQRFVVEELMRSVRPTKGEPHVASACLLSLAMLAESDEELALLCSRSSHKVEAWLADSELDPRLRAHAPRLVTAIASVATEGKREIYAKALLAALAARPRADVETGLVQALGRIQVADEKLAGRVAEVLMEATRKGAPLSRRLAWIALGRRAAAPFGEKAGKFLVKSTKKPRAAIEPWIALAIGVWSDGEIRAERVPSEDVRRIARFSMENTRSRETQAAWALCAGMGRDAEAVPSIGALASDCEPGERLGVLAAALGMTRSSQAIEPLRGLAAAADHDGEALEMAAVALTLTGDREGPARLLDGFGSACCRHSSAAHAKALARVGDPRIVLPLLETVSDDDRHATDRAWAAHALGRLARGVAQPWRSELSIGLNYGAALSTLSSSDLSGLLDQG